MTEREGTNEPGAADEFDAAQDALVGQRDTSTGSVPFDELRAHIARDREDRHRR